MDRINRILVFNDSTGPTNALERATSLAKRNGGKLTLMDVVHSAPIFFKNVVPTIESDLTGETRKREHVLEQLAEPIRRDGIDVTVKAIMGRPLVELIREVVAGKHQLVMKDARAERNELFFGSLDMRLLRYCPVPLWQVNPAPGQPTNRILVAIDPEVVEHGMKLNEKIMKMASRLARRDDCELHVVSAWHPPADMMSNEDEYRERYSKFKDTVRQRARECLNRALRASVVDVGKSNVYFRTGDTHEVIINVVDETHPDLLVMGTLARAGVSGILIGNTAEKVLRCVRCSVLTDKPDDFLSPVADEL